MFGPAHAKALEELRTAQLQLAQAWMRSECEDLLDGEHAELAKRSFGRDRVGGAGEAGVAVGGESGDGAANPAGGEAYSGSERGGSSGTAGGVGGSNAEGGPTVGGGSGSGSGGVRGSGGGGGGTGAAAAAAVGGTGEPPMLGSATGAAVPGLGGFGGASFGSSASSLREGGDSGIEKDTLLARKRRELNYAHFDRVSRSVVDVIQKLENVAGAMGVVQTKSREIWGSEASDDNSSSKWGPERPR